MGVRKILDSWKEDQHPYMTYEVKQLIQEVESAINPILEAIEHERTYQDQKWGTVIDHPHDVGGWLTLIRKELREAEDAWCSEPGDKAALCEILQVASVCAACLEQHGIVERDLED